MTESRAGQASYKLLDTDARDWKSGQETVLTVPSSRERRLGDRLYLLLKRRADGRVIQFANQGADDKVPLGEFIDG